MMGKFLNKIEDWFDQRYDLEPIKEFIKHKKVPVHRYSIWYYLGGVTLFLLIIQILTGLLLLLYYQPGENSSYESVRFIVTHVKFGWLIRSIHSWSANLLVFFAFLHMFSVYFTEAYQKPRELTWVTGFLSFALILGFGFSGYLLPWNELSFFATKVGTGIVGVLPVIGKPLMEILRGGTDVTGATISRFFGIHVAILPIVLVLFLAVHLLFVQKQGMHEPAEFKNLPESNKKYIPFFPNFVLKDTILWLIVFNILLFLSVYFPWDLGLKANPLSSAPAGIKPEWYFMFMFQSLKFFPPHILFFEGEIVGIVGFGLAGLLWLLVPFFPLKNKSKIKIKVRTVIGIFIIVFIIMMTALGYLL